MNTAKLKTAKFGGSSLANAAQIKKVIEIIRADPTRRCIVVSAPGKTNPGDKKITDMLYTLAEPPNESSRNKVITAIIVRYQHMARDLGLKIKFLEWFNWEMNALEKIFFRCRKDFLASRGEYWMAQIIALALGYKFIDASQFISFNDMGLLDIKKTHARAALINLAQTAEHEGIVIPGFYGTLRGGEIKTFSRGGSDITGAIVALCTSSDIYENWTDVNGVLMADPRIVNNPHRTDYLTYRELRELAYMGANVLHEDAIFPVREVGIPINIRNTNKPLNAGTLISTTVNQKLRIPGRLIGVAGKKGFSVIKIEKGLMNNELGFLQRICQVMTEHKINIEHIPGGIDTLSVIVSEEEFNPLKESVLQKIIGLCQPDLLTVESGMAMICIVIAEMMESPEITARICSSLSDVNIKIRMINQGASAISIIIGVDQNDCDDAIRAIYHEFAF